MLIRQDVRAYLDIALDVLDIPLWFHEVGKQTTWELEKKRRYWSKKAFVAAGWSAFGRRNGSRLTYEGTIDELIAGAFSWQDEHVATWHSVLTLDQYGLKWDKVWGPVGTPIPYTEDEFAELLRRALSEHRDPLHLLRRHVEKRLFLGIDGPGSPMILKEIENQNRGLDNVRDLQTARVGESLTFSILTQTEGYVLLLSRLHRTNEVFILNEILERPRSDVFQAYQLMRFKTVEPTGDPGLRDIIAINWPKQVDPSHYGVSDFFARTDPNVDQNELRRLGAAIADTANNPDERRVFARMKPLELLPKA